jgi:hypothetical protein
MKEKILWLLFAAALVGIFVASKDGFYRYPCQNPDKWALPQCQPPLCTAAKECPEDLIGDANG